MILHLDLDCFFVSAERIKDSSLIGREVAVGGRSDQFIFGKNLQNKKAMIANSGAFVPSLFFSKKRGYSKEFFKDGERIRGIITTASYEARKHGIKTGMSIKEALLLCPNLIVLPPDMILYHTLSFKLRNFLQKELPLVEQYSIDEFFADSFGWIEKDEIFDFAKTLQKNIKDKFSLPISIGIADTKWIAKLATSKAKPNGVKLVKKEEIEEFIKDIPIEEFPGIGRAWRKKLYSYKKQTLFDIYNSKTLLYSWGRAGKELYDKVSGTFFEDVNRQRERKTIGISRTFDPILDRNEIKRRIYILVRHLSFILQKTGKRPSTIYISIKYEFGEKSKKHKTFNRIFTESFLKEEFIKLFNEIDIYKNSSIIRLSLSLSHFYSHKNHIFCLLHFQKDKKEEKLYKNIGKLREKYGIDIVKNGVEVLS